MGLSQKLFCQRKIILFSFLYYFRSIAYTFFNYQYSPALPPLSKVISPAQDKSIFIFSRLGLSS